MFKLAAGFNINEQAQDFLIEHDQRMSVRTNTTVIGS